ncbi:hypothetical protein [Cryptosporangium arvum]|uniref:hypothetical protein n=1 Tax=Cryptosporangium arvum TaxID=80871 RepID=UPI0004B5A603|nr:hypothetical protein [Cryptosporangium arvum]
MRLSYLAPPFLLAAYGVVRLFDGLDGSHGPGPAWTIGHVLFLVALLGFGGVAVDLGRRLRTVPAFVAAGATLLGLAAFVHTVVVDLVVASGAADRAEMNLRYRDHATPLDPVAPLYPIGFTVLVLLLAIAARRAYWSPVLVLLGYLAIVVNLDLLPLAGLVILGASIPAARDNDRQVRPTKGPNGRQHAGI